MKTKTLRVILAENEDGKYIPFCNFEKHTGIALRYWICEERQCRHYQRLYVEFYNYNKRNKKIKLYSP